ncbi:Ferredoxin/ferredoxin--NADP reductase [Actinidia chinensis var. chinensis]|uniref:Ferredoxin/ferredoxin--NADP reductase n=1 Tax=Actinidia chinensis var. chinensis TaxID=1590841 RepID=A0A2R6RNN4_ACTCC|nr:Ferredoxin/ferredoxin--NADP reductase [Actinidia chinensis var. chinensis]
MGTAPPHPSPIECCMCGDYGLSYELFKCKICQIRSQHRYCSNQYPKAESYRICNWCLIDTTEKTPHNSSNSPPSSRANTQLSHDHVIKKKKKIHDGGQNGQKSSPLKLQGCSIKKLQRSQEGSPLPAGRKRVIDGSGGEVDERLTRTKSEEVSNMGGVNKPVFRNKVRRYKLLEEVSS